MNKVKRIFILIILAPVIYLASCHKFGSHPSWDTQILAPLIKTTLSINNIITNTSVKSNPDSSITLVYSDSLYNMTTDSLFKIPDTTLLYSYVSFFSTSIPGGTQIIGNTSNNQYNVGSGVQLKQAIIQSGKVKVEITSHIQAITDYTYSVPSATLNGTPLNIYEKVPAAISASKPSHIVKYYPLNGYNVDFTGPNHNQYNTVTTVLNGILDSQAPTTNINPGDSIVIKVTFDSIVPYYGDGYFGKNVKTIGPQTTAFPLFSRIVSGSLNLQDVKVNFTLENGFGVDARINVTQLTSINSHIGSAVPLADASLINTAININRATRTFNPANPVSPSIKTFNINPTNSTILPWVNNLPTSIGYTLQITTDPLGNVSGSTDFAFLNHGIKAYLDVSVPLSLIASNLTMADTIPVNFASSAQAQQIKSGTFTLYATNGFPFSAVMQVYLLDKNMHITDSLLNPIQTIVQGITNATGKVINPQNSTLTIPVSSSQMPLLLSAPKIIIMARFNTGCPSCSPPQYSKIYDYYKLNIKLVGNFDYRVKG